jgi:hypothetical protein
MEVAAVKVMVHHMVLCLVSELGEHGRVKTKILTLLGMGVVEPPVRMLPLAQAVVE